MTFSLLLALAGSVSIYLASPRQQWRAHPWPAHPACIGGALLLALSLAVLGRSVQGVVAVFVLCTWLMLLWVTMPYLGALGRLWRRMPADSVAPAARIQRDWLGKTLAGGLLGFTLALACSGVFHCLTPEMVIMVKAQLAMWMVVPLWLTVFSLSFLFQNARRAWLCLGAANLVLYALFILLRLSVASP